MYLTPSPPRVVWHLSSCVSVITKVNTNTNTCVPRYVKKQLCIEVCVTRDDLQTSPPLIARISTLRLLVASVSIVGVPHSRIHIQYVLFTNSGGALHMTNRKLTKVEHGGALGKVHTHSSVYDR